MSMKCEPFSGWLSDYFRLKLFASVFVRLREFPRWISVCLHKQHSAQNDEHCTHNDQHYSNDLLNKVCAFML